MKDTVRIATISIDTELHSPHVDNQTPRNTDRRQAQTD